MRKIVMLAALVALSGCTPKELQQCEDAIKAKLRSPATYKQASADCSSTGSCEIAFDAANAYGTPIRDKAHCYTSTGKAQVFLDSEMKID